MEMKKLNSKQKKKIQELIKRDLQEAQYVGEDGGMVVDARFAARGAWQKMINRLREDCGEIEVEEFMDRVKADDLGMAYFHLVTDDNDGVFEPDCEWYVSIEEKSPYKVWVYWG